MIESKVSILKANINEGKNAEEVFLNSRATASITVTNIVPIDNNSLPIDTSRTFQGQDGNDAFVNYLNSIQEFLENIFKDLKNLRASGGLTNAFQDPYGNIKSASKDERSVGELEFPSVEKIMSFYRFRTQALNLFEQGQLIDNNVAQDEEFDEDGNEIRPATAATDKSRKGPIKPTRETGRVCVILIAGILKAFMKISEVGSGFIEEKI